MHSQKHKEGDEKENTRLRRPSDAPSTTATTAGGGAAGNTNDSDNGVDEADYPHVIPESQESAQAVLCSQRPDAKRSAGSPSDAAEGAGQRHAKRARSDEYDCREGRAGELEPPADRRKALAEAIRREASALEVLEATRKEIDAHRLAIRSAGETELDSLLVVERDGICHVLAYSNVRDLCRFERVCKAFKTNSSAVWTSMDEEIGRNKSTSSDDPKTRCIRHGLASEYAAQMEERASKHCLMHYENLSFASENPDIEDAYIESSLAYCQTLQRNPIPPETCGWARDLERRVGAYQAKEEGPCKFPNALEPIDSSCEELFLRVTRPVSPPGSSPLDVMYEGFCPLRFDRGAPCLDLRGAHCPNWAELVRFQNLVGSNEDEGTWYDASLCVFKSLLCPSGATLTFVAMSGGNEPRLVASFGSVFGETVTSAGHDEIYHRHPGGRPDWASKFWGVIPKRPHSTCKSPTEHSYRRVEFGWSMDLTTFGFRFKDRTEDNDYDKHHEKPWY